MENEMHSVGKSNRITTKQRYLKYYHILGIGKTKKRQLRIDEWTWIIEAEVFTIGERTW